MWHRVAKKGDFKEDGGQILEIEGQKIALFRAQGKFYAILNQCPHRGGPLVEGQLEGTKVTCPWHAWEFDVSSGECLTLKGGAKQKTYPTKIEKDDVWVDV